MIKAVSNIYKKMLRELKLKILNELPQLYVKGVLTNKAEDRFWRIMKVSNRKIVVKEMEATKRGPLMPIDNFFVKGAEPLEISYKNNIKIGSELVKNWEGDVY